MKRVYEVMRYANQIPMNPPIAVKIIDDIENTPAPHSSGTHPPTIDPITIPIQIIDFIYT